MSKISLVLPANSWHANLLPPDMERMDKDGFGLQIFLDFGIPVTIFAQGVDMMMRRWLCDQAQIPGCVEWGRASFSHTLIPLTQGRQWQIENRFGFSGNVDVGFSSEFYVPRPDWIPHKFTLVLEDHSVLYSSCGVLPSSTADVAVKKYPEHSPSIEFGGKIGILLREKLFGSFLKAFFLFQRFPIEGTHPDGRNCLTDLIGEVRRIDSEGGDAVIVCPLDLEAVWIGSCFGARVWEIFFEELKKEGLTHVFTPLSKHLEMFKSMAVSTLRPHRSLGKWSTYEIQVLHREKLNRICPIDEREWLVKMIATGSDIFAAWGIKFDETRKRIVLPGVNTSGKSVGIPITFSQSVIDTQLAACTSLENETTFLDELNKIPIKDYFIRLAIEMAEREGL